MTSRGWVGVPFPFRDDTWGTYDTWSYNTLPPIPEDNVWYDILTIEDLIENKDELFYESPIGCYYDFDKKTGKFYNDSQGCTWFLNKKGQVYIPYDDRDLIVSETLSEFLYRIEIENEIWWKCYNTYMKNYNEEDFLQRPWSENLFTINEDYYFNHYVELYKNNISVKYKENDNEIP